MAWIITHRRKLMVIAVVIVLWTVGGLIPPPKAPDAPSKQVTQQEKQPTPTPPSKAEAGEKAQAPAQTPEDKVEAGKWYTQTKWWVSIIITTSILLATIILLVKMIRMRPTSDTTTESEGEDSDEDDVVTSREKKVITYVAGTIAAVVVLALLFVFVVKPWFSGPPNQAETDVAQTNEATVIETDPIDELPAQVALPVICGCESNDCKPPGKQFDSDGKLVTNPTSGAIGACQILPGHLPRAKSLNLDIEKSMEDNMRFAEVLYTEERTGPWRASRSRWQPILAALTRTKKFEVSVQAPGDDGWTSFLDVPPGYSFDSRSMSGHQAQNDKGEVVSYDPTKPACFEDADDRNQCFAKITEKVRFRSKNTKGEEVLVRYFPFRVRAVN